MNLWWLITSSVHCSYDELKRRQCVALGWAEIGSLEKYLKDKPGWERQFKTLVQVRGNLAYARDKRWTETASALSGVPSLLWSLLQMRAGDFVVVMESGNQLTLGRLEVRGITQLTEDGMTSYSFEEGVHHAHQISKGLTWVDWDRAHLGELEMPKQSFFSLLQDNEQLETVKLAWEQRPQR
ncbi:hypothetical protein [Saccharospirillum alexandrii]|uniref:hypothetical protein n=1 Tax=Saccharospirillum alexandrii TaxID=2448477 RepID=UPI003735DE83